MASVDTSPLCTCAVLRGTAIALINHRIFVVGIICLGAQTPAPTRLFLTIDAQRVRITRKSPNQDGKSRQGIPAR
jgi:hypothetical protein